MSHNLQVINSPELPDAGAQPELPVIVLPRGGRAVSSKRRDVQELSTSLIKVHDEGVDLSFVSENVSVTIDVKWSALRILKELFK